MSKRRSFSIAEKVDIIEYLEAGATITDVSRKLKISQSTISTIWKSRSRIKEKFDKDVTTNKKIKSSIYKDIEDALLEWIRVQNDLKIPLSRPILQEKANYFGKLFNKPDFTCSHSWIIRFQKRNNIITDKVGEDAVDLSKSITDNWLQSFWPAFRQNYEDSDIYNADETGLFFRLTPDKALALKGKICYGGKLSKERLTVLIASNITGSDKKKLLVVGKSKPLQCYKNEILPIEYKCNQKAWMTSDIFMDWLKQWDVELGKQNRKILLTVDNSSSHPPEPNLQNIELMILPPCATDILHPMEQGIIKTLKTKYRKTLMLKILNISEDCKNCEISLPDALNMLVDAWSEVSESCIENSFLLAGFKRMTDDKKIIEVSHQFDKNDFQELVTLLHPVYSRQQVDDFINVDKFVATNELPTDEYIDDSILKAEDNFD